MNKGKSQRKFVANEPNQLQTGEDNQTLPSQKFGAKRQMNDAGVRVIYYANWSL